MMYKKTVKSNFFLIKKANGEEAQEKPQGL